MMHELYQLKESLCEELKAYGKKGEVSAGSLAMIDTLAHAVKNLDKIIEKHEEEEEMYSSETMPYRPVHEGGYMRSSYEGSSRRGGSSRASYEGSSARGRGRSSRRDAMGRYSRENYSRDDEMMAELQELMRNAPDDRMRQKIQSIMEKMEEM